MNVEEKYPLLIGHSLAGVPEQTNLRKKLMERRIPI